MFDDPRTYPSTSKSRGRSESRRPQLVRHISDNALLMGNGSQSRSGNATPRGDRGGGGRSISRHPIEKDKNVKVNLGGKRSERLSSMCKGLDGNYAVGGPHCTSTHLL